MKAQLRTDERGCSALGMLLRHNWLSRDLSVTYPPPRGWQQNVGSCGRNRDSVVCGSFHWRHSNRSNLVTVGILIDWTLRCQETKDTTCARFCFVFSLRTCSSTILFFSCLPLSADVYELPEVSLIIHSVHPLTRLKTFLKRFCWLSFPIYLYLYC